jgi:hypothetical protein
MQRSREEEKEGSEIRRKRRGKCAEKKKGK